MDQWLIDTIEEIQSSGDVSDIKTVLVKIREYFEFANVTYAVKLPQTFTQSSLLLISDYPVEWFKRYGEQGYINVDPVVSHCLNSQTPYEWQRFKEHSKKEVIDFVGEADEFKLRDGISVGMPSFDGKPGLISLASDHQLTLSHRQRHQINICLNTLQPFLHTRICQVTDTSQQSNISIHLTEREKTCLVWVAEGKTAHDIAAILVVSEATVVFHLKNAIQKLDVTNRSQAIARAVLLGLITPQFTGRSVPTYHF